MPLLLLLLACGGSADDTGDRSFTTTTTWTGATSTGPTCGSLLGDAIQAYDALIEDNRGCVQPTDCHLVSGSCAMGIGNAQEAVNLDVVQADVDAILDSYRADAQALGCQATTRTCDSTQTWQAVCEGGLCSAAPSSTY